MLETFPRTIVKLATKIYFLGRTVGRALTSICLELGEKRTFDLRLERIFWPLILIFCQAQGRQCP